jgi:FAD synthase
MGGRGQESMSKRNQVIDLNQGSFTYQWKGDEDVSTISTEAFIDSLYTKANRAIRGKGWKTEDQRENQIKAIQRAIEGSNYRFQEVLEYAVKKTNLLEYIEWDNFHRLSLALERMYK